jgi:hypothetical protein
VAARCDEAGFACGGVEGRRRKVTLPCNVSRLSVAVGVMMEVGGTIQKVTAGSDDARLAVDRAGRLDAVYRGGVRRNGAARLHPGWQHGGGRGTGKTVWSRSFDGWTKSDGRAPSCAAWLSAMPIGIAPSQDDGAAAA